MGVIYGEIYGDIQLSNVVVRQFDVGIVPRFFARTCDPCDSPTYPYLGYPLVPKIE